MNTAERFASGLKTHLKKLDWAEPQKDSPFIIQAWEDEGAEVDWYQLNKAIDEFIAVFKQRQKR